MHMSLQILTDKSHKRHAFIGIGFRERFQASDFNAALVEYRQQLSREEEAKHLAEEFESGPKKDYSLQGNIKLTLKQVWIDDM